MSTHFRHADYCCPHCDFDSGAPGRCPFCESPLHDQRCAAPWQIESRRAWRRSQSTTMTAFLSVASIMLIELLFSVSIHAPALVAPLVALTALLGFAYHRYSPAQLRAWRGRRMHRGLVEKPAKTATDGERVTFSGATTLLRPALGPEGDALIAFERDEYINRFRGQPIPFEDNDWRTAPHRLGCSSGGEFELRSADGVPVRVRLDDFVLLGGVSKDGCCTIPEFSDVRVSGVARWVDDDQTSSFRSRGRRLELVSAPGQPIVIEVVSHAAESQANSSSSDDASALRGSDVRVVTSAPRAADEREFAPRESAERPAASATRG